MVKRKVKIRPLSRSHFICELDCKKVIRVKKVKCTDGKQRWRLMWATKFYKAVIPTWLGEKGSVAAKLVLKLVRNDLPDEPSKKNKLILVKPRKFTKDHTKMPWEACVMWNRTHQDTQAEYLILAKDVKGRAGFKGRNSLLACAIYLRWNEALHEGVPKFSNVTLHG